MNKTFLVFLLSIFMIGSVLALGVSPARSTIDFEPSSSKSGQFEVINSENQDINLRIFAEGDLAEYISIDSSRISLSSSEKSKKVGYTLNFPENVDPGLTEGGIVISEIPEDSDSSGSYVRATLAVIFQIHVHAPYPGKYANAQMYVYSEGTSARFVIPVVSAGEFDLSSVRANVDIYNKLNEKIDTFNTAAVAIPVGAKKELVYDWDISAPVGEYLAKATLIYDEGTLSLEEKFSLGKRELELQEIAVGDFSLGEIAKLEMLVENKWSEDISDVHVETKIKASSGNVVSSFESAAQDIDALSKQVFVSYWDTAGVSVGDYDADISINYGDKSSDKSLTFEVSENELVIVGLGYVISEEGSGGSNSVVVVLIVIIVVLVMINLLWFFVLRKKLGGKK